MEHIHFYQRSVVPRDIPDPAEMDINTCYLSVSGTTQACRHQLGASGSSRCRPSRCCMRSPAARRPGAERPFVSQSNCFVVPPLKFADRRLPLPGDGGARRHARAAALGRPGRGDGAGGAGGRHRPGGGGGAGGASPTSTPSSRASGHLRALALRLRPQDRRHVGREPGAGACSARVRADGAFLRPHRRHLLGHQRLQGAGRPGAVRRRPTTTPWSAMPAPTSIYESAGMHASLLGFSLESLVIDNDTIGASRSASSRAST